MRNHLCVDKSNYCLKSRRTRSHLLSVMRFILFFSSKLREHRVRAVEVNIKIKNDFFWFIMTASWFELQCSCIHCQRAARISQFRCWFPSSLVRFVIVKFAINDFFFVSAFILFIFIILCAELRRPNGDRMHILGM